MSHISQKDIDRFWSKVNKTESCWEWCGSISKKGYGHFWCSPSTYRAHRFAWIATNGQILNGLSVCHRCDNRKCVRPDHLFLGTQKDNIVDCRDKRRLGIWVRADKAKRGEANHFSKLTSDNIRHIRQQRLDGVSGSTLAMEFGVCQSTIYKASLGNSWRHIKEGIKSPSRKAKEQI